MITTNNILRNGHVIGRITTFIDPISNLPQGRQLHIPAFNLKAQVFPKTDENKQPLPTYRVSLPENYVDKTTNAQKTFWHDIGTIDEDNKLHLPAFDLTADIK